MVIQIIVCLIRYRTSIEKTDLPQRTLCSLRMSEHRYPRCTVGGPLRVKNLNENAFRHNPDVSKRKCKSFLHYSRRRDNPLDSHCLEPRRPGSTAHSVGLCHPALFSLSGLAGHGCIIMHHRSRKFLLDRPPTSQPCKLFEWMATEVGNSQMSYADGGIGARD